jgi:NAD(P)-dependent dehydrogenase (short-subunit alcohol dehydrogenase family)
MPKTIIVTGASDGIGAAAARRLSIDGHRVVIVGRSPKKTSAIAAELGADHFVADFASLDSVRALAADIAAAYPRIDVLANNAGGVFGDPARTVDGHEKTMQVNHLAPFLLTNLLMPVLLDSRASVIQTSSDAARITGRLVVDDLDNDRGRSAVRTYGDAKLANILFTSELHARFGERGLSSAAFHPGTVATGFASDTASASMRFVYANPLIRRFIATPMSAATQLVWLAEGEPGTDWRPGGYYEKRALAKKTNPQTADAALARRLWETSAEMVGL